MTSSTGIPGLRASSTGAALRGVAAAVCARPTAAAAAAAAIVWCAVWIAVEPAGSAPPAADALIAVPGLEPSDPLSDERGAVRRGRCPTCGTVVGIREVQPAGFEFTVRLRDGSMRISNAASRGSWHIGDRVMLMGEAAVHGQ